MLKQRLIYVGLMMLITLVGLAQRTEKIYLSGRGNDQRVNWDFFCTAGMNAGKWTTIPVPSNWELEGFGKYDYGFSKDATRGKEQGLYRYKFKVDHRLKGNSVHLVFEGVMTDAEVKVNGVAAGALHQGAFYAFRYNVTNLLQYDKENLLEVTVSKHSANPSVNAAERKADFWIFGGIFRPVYLEVLPPSHISSVKIHATHQGTFFASVMHTVSGADKITVQVYDANNKIAGPAFSKFIQPGSENTSLETRYLQIKTWTAETPRLYKAVITLSNAGRPLHVVQHKFGFRTVEVKQRDGLYINGVKVKMKGVCRHTFWPESGRTSSYTLSLKDVQLMKEMNMNAVRSSHYPPDDHFLEVCDSLGLYVMDELAGWHGQYDTPTGALRVKEMLDHDVNHPSIIFWANGNEGGHNVDLDSLFTRGDPQGRPVIHPWQDFGGFDTQHYREYNYGIGNYDMGHSIIMPTEFLHGMWDGGHGAGLEDYWEAMWQNPRGAGGFLWDFADEGVVRRDKNDSIDTDGNHGADGIVGPYHEKEGSFYTIKEVWSPVHFEKKDITPSFDGTFNIENRYHFTNLKETKFEFVLKKLGRLGVDYVSKKQGPNIAPGAKGSVSFALPSNWHDYDVINITVKDPSNATLFTWSFPILLPKENLKRIMPAEQFSDFFQCSLQDSMYTIDANEFRYKISAKDGLLKEVQYNQGSIPFNNGPIVQDGSMLFKNIQLFKTDTAFIIRSTFDKKDAWNTVEWTIYKNGVLKMQVNYFPGTYFPVMAGVHFSFPEAALKRITYIGDGPNRVWKNRMKGNLFGLWHKDFNNAATGENPLDYPEFKGFYSRMYQVKMITDAYSFTVATPLEDCFLRLFTPKVSDDPYNNVAPVFPVGDISFMHGISGIGTKTQRASTTGPMGQPYAYYDYEKDPARALNIILYFYFDK